MAITGYTGPEFKSIQPAYNPIIYRVQDISASVPTVIYCDIYFNHFYYKTLSSNSPVLIIGGSSFWDFDISGIAQEFLESKIDRISRPEAATGTPIMGEIFTVPPYIVAGTHYGATRCYVKFRTSTVDAYGVVTPEGPVPIQATVDSPAYEGAGYAADNFMIVNAASQWNYQIADLEKHLNSYRRTGVFGLPGLQVNPLNKIYPLSHLVKGNIYANDFGSFPILIMRDGFYVWGGSSYIYSASQLVSVALEMYDINGARIYYVYSAFQTLESESIYTIPVGIENLSVLFPLMTTYISNCHYYQVFIWNSTSIGGDVLFVTPKYYIRQASSTNAPDHVRIWFKNYLGQMDQINFKVRNEITKVNSLPTETPEIYRHDGDNIKRKGMSRNNVRSNEHNEVSDVFQEWELPLLKELMGTADAYIEVPDIEWPYIGIGTREYSSTLLPIVIEDAEYITRRYEDRYQYEVFLKYRFSHENKIIRN